MTTSIDSSITYDPYDADICANPYPIFARLREEAPLYYNEQYNFFALSRFDDVERGLGDFETYSSARGNMLEVVNANIEIPSGVFIFEDPPMHRAHRSVLSKVFTPRKMMALEPQIRQFCAQVLDPLVGTERFDFVEDLGAIMPMRVIGMLLGIPVEDQQAVREKGDKKLRHAPGMPTDPTLHNFADGSFFADYINWRASHPSDDLMTELIQAEFEDPDGTVRRLTTDEILIFINILATAGNETTNRVLGWSGKILAEHPDQRRLVREDRSLISPAVEEILRCEPPAHQAARYVTRDVELHGQTVPAGSTMLLLLAAANRDHRAFPPDGDVFDVRRVIDHHLTFGRGIHFCLGASLARLEARVALDEILNRFPEWQVDVDNAQMDSSTVRGWKSLPTIVSR
ncbi:cytochrome P450 [Pseudofrankia asymbiotica]|uniref:Cytochrome n=1 Tax=Pseudofrankia asymbiotica TaxID=1834516 RepID=A0A1V2I6U0_9ACTN|nr:cytochrome P450 [Pseudofrankia asymbiotica]ONH27153.1 cytochrome [Pseudofrankia asymbiotica]